MQIEMSDLMQENYLNYYILSYFKTGKIVRTSQILHILRGKRTPSMFYLTEVNDWHHGFSVKKRVEREELKKAVHYFAQNKWLIKKEKGYLLTNLGQEKLDVFFSKHYLPNKINHFSNLSLRRPFWERYQLFSQVFSEYSYQNSQYIPIVKDPVHQETVRQLFQVGDENKDFLLQQWFKEQIILFGQIEEAKASILVNILTGHERIGKTTVQLAQELEMQEDEFSFYLRDLLEEFIEMIKEKRLELPLVYKILEQTNEEMFLGLSQSTYQSYQLLQQGATIQQIANKRYLKESTVKEHILEMAFILEEFPVQYFMSEQIYEYLNQEFEKNQEYSFKQAVTKNEEIEFYQYRLVGLERMRSN